MRAVRWFLLAASSAVAMGCGGGGDVHVTHAEIWGRGPGALTTVPDAENFVVAATAIVGRDVSGRRIAGTIDADGRVTFSGVPSGPYILELRYAIDPEYPDDLPRLLQIPIDGDRSVRLGSDHWSSGEGALLDESSTLTFDLSGTAAFADEDVLDVLSVGSSFYVGATFDSVNPDYTNPPADGATSSTGWIVPALTLDWYYELDGVHLPSAGDDLTLVHLHEEIVDFSIARLDAWAFATLESAVGVATIPSPALTNGAPNTIAATLVAPPVANVLIDFRGSEWAELRTIGGYPATTTSTATIRMTNEIGTGPGFYASPAATSWKIRASARRVPVNPTCYPDAGGECDVIACGGVCDAQLTTDRVDPMDMGRYLPLPNLALEGQRAVLGVSYSHTVRFEHPTSGISTTYSATSSLTRPASALAEPIRRGLPPPTNLRVDGMTNDFATTHDLGSLTPTIAFDASAGAEHYVITILALRPDDESEADVASRDQVVAATIYSRATSITVPADVLRPDVHYVARVSARRNGRDLATPYVSRADSTDLTEVVSSPFRF